MESFLAALQLADGALPVGRFVHSHGLEAWLHAEPTAGEAELAELISSAVCEGAAPLDGAVLAHAHRSAAPAELFELDRALTARKLVLGARRASCACGRRLAALGATLVDDALVEALATAVRAGGTDGNLAVVEGVLGRAMGISVEEAVAIELRGFATGLLSAAVRLGRLTPGRAQVVLWRLREPLSAATSTALATAVGDLRSGALELELHALAHPRAEVRFFQS